MSFLTHSGLFSVHDSELWQVTATGVMLSHAMHYLSMILIYHLAHLVNKQLPRMQQDFAVLTAILYTISPAGVFLSAPYSEPLFAFCNLFGLLLYLRGISQASRHQTSAGPLLVILAGAVFGFATAVRCNG